jgi:hypothetical protein
MGGRRERDAVTLPFALLGSGVQYADIQFLGWLDPITATTTGSPVADLSPLNPRAGDFCLVAGVMDNGAAADLLPTDYDFFLYGSAGDLPRAVATGTILDPGQTTITLGDGAAANNRAWLVGLFRYVDPDVPVDNVASASGATGNPNPPSTSAKTLDTMSVALGFLDDDIYTSGGGAPSGWGNLAIGAVTSGSVVAAALLAVASAGSVDPGAFSGLGNDEWVASNVILRRNRPYYSLSGDALYAAFTLFGTASKSQNGDGSTRITTTGSGTARVTGLFSRSGQRFATRFRVKHISGTADVQVDYADSSPEVDTLSIQSLLNAATDFTWITRVYEPGGGGSFLDFGIFGARSFDVEEVRIYEVN